MKTVILAGGLGTRLSEETTKTPKPLVEIGGKPILWHIIKTYSAHGINDFIICLGYKGYVVKEYFSNYALHSSNVTFDLRNDRMEVHQNASEPWRITLIDTGHDTQTGGRLRRVSEFLDPGEPFCFTYGDGVSDVDITKSIAFHREHGRLATVTSITPPGRFGVLQMHNDEVTGFLEKVDNVDTSINGGFFVLQPEVIDLIDDDSSIWERKPMETLAAQRQLMAFHHSGFWHPMDTLRDKHHLEDLWDSGKAPWKIWS